MKKETKKPHNLRFRPSWANRVLEQAEKENRSFNNMIEVMAIDYLKQKEKADDNGKSAQH